MDDPAPKDPALPVLARSTAVKRAKSDSPIPRVELDYLMLAILVRIQHLRHAEAKLLVDALIAMGVETVEVLMAKAVVENALGAHPDVLTTLTQLDRLDPPQFRKGKKADPRVRMRSFLKARATYAIHGELDAEGRASLDFYLRQGRDDADAT